MENEKIMITVNFFTSVSSTRFNFFHSRAPFLYFPCSRGITTFCSLTNARLGHRREGFPLLVHFGPPLPCPCWLHFQKPMFYVDFKTMRVFLFLMACVRRRKQPCCKKAMCRLCGDSQPWGITEQGSAFFSGRESWRWLWEQVKGRAAASRV